MGKIKGNETVRSIFNGAAGILILATLILIIVNCCRFISSSRTRKPLILLFYTFAFIHCVNFLTQVILREYDRYVLEHKNVTMNEFLNIDMLTAGTLTSACAFSVDGITMLSLALAIQLVLKKLSRKAVRWINRIYAVILLTLISCSTYFSIIYSGI